jgi:hypothetical protein
VAVAHDLGKQAQLADGAAALALQARRGQGAFGLGALDQRVAYGHDVVGDFFQERGALFCRQAAIGIERSLRQARGAVDLDCAAQAEGGLDFLITGRVKGAQAAFAAAHGNCANEHFAGNARHECFSTNLIKIRQPR